jgi:hypothetical protein
MITVKMHQGRVLVDDLATYYDDLFAVSSEQVQNAIDARATRIVQIMDLKRRTLETLDNGNGLSQERMTKALQNVRESLKDEREDYGKFGIGLFAALSIFDGMTVCSCPAPRVTGYTEYPFKTQAIREQAQVVIDERPAEGLRFDPSGKVWWRTRYISTGLTTDRRKSTISLPELARSIAFHYGVKIRERNIDITLVLFDAKGGRAELKVVAPEFSGKELPTFTATIKECGRVEVKLYVALLARVGRKGTIGFGNLVNPSRISEAQFVACACRSLDQQVSHALRSGVFEGTVLCEKISLHPTRKRFVEDDALFGLCEALERWFREQGKTILQETEAQDADKRFQRIGLEVMPFAEQLIKQESFQALALRFELGTTGVGHARIPKKQVIGTEEATAMSSGGGVLGKRPSTEEGSGDGRDIPKKENTEHKPGIVYGPKGKRRTEVQGSSTGLRFEYVEMEQFQIPFDFDAKSGTLSFNVNHPGWGQCQEKDEFLRRYHIAVLTSALLLETYRNGEGSLDPDLKHYAHEFLTHQTFAIINGDALTTKLKA